MFDARGQPPALYDPCILMHTGVFLGEFHQYYNFLNLLLERRFYNTILHSIAWSCNPDIYYALPTYYLVRHFDPSHVNQEPLCGYEPKPMIPVQGLEEQNRDSTTNFRNYPSV